MYCANQAVTGEHEEVQPETVYETSPVSSSEQAPELSQNRPDATMVFGSDRGEATETASERGSDTCSTQTASEIEMLL